MRGSMQGMPMPIRLLAVALLASVISAPVLAAQAVGQVSGTVYLERDGQGARSPVEPGLPGVVVSNGKPLPSTIVDVARSLGIPLVTAPHPKYQCCVRVHQARVADGLADA